MKAKHFLPLLAAVIAACALILGLGGKKTTKGTLPPAAPSVSTTAPRQMEETASETEATAETKATAAPTTAEPTETTEAAAEGSTEPETTPPETEAPTASPETQPAEEKTDERDYVANKNSLKFHYPTCSSVEKIKPSNRWDFHGTREELIAKGYQPCKRCSP